MNELKKIVGKKIPFVWDDFEYVQAAQKEAFFGLLSAFGVDIADSFKISGCDVTEASGTYTSTAGYLALAGEIYKVDAHSVTPSSGEIVYWDVVEVADAIGNKEDSEGTFHDTYINRRAKLVAGAAPASYLQYNCDTMQDKINDLASRDLGSKNDTTSWKSPTWKNGWISSPSSATGSGFFYRLDQFGYLELQGNIIPTNATSDIVCNFPAGYRPSSVGFFYGVAVGHNTGAVESFKVNHDGDLIIPTFSGSETAYHINMRVKLV